MTSTPSDAGLQSPLQSDTESSTSIAQSATHRALPRLSLPYRRSNASVASLFASTSSAQHSPTASGTSTPPAGVVNASVFSPPASRLANALNSPTTAAQPDEARQLVLRAFAPRVSVLASDDCQELLRHKGINGGLLELLRPFGEKVGGRVVVRDSTGASRPWDDFGIRFTGVSDGLEPPRLDSSPSDLPEYRPARLRTGGDVEQIDELVARHLRHAQDQPSAGDYFSGPETKPHPSQLTPFYTLYLRRLLSGIPVTPHETFSHPVALVIAISSRNPAPIDELRTLYTSSNTGQHKPPPWVNNEFLRYYVLIHDEDHDDITKSTALYEQMKRHFGLHCHLLRLRSNECLPSDDDSTRLPTCEWLSAGEELSEIANRVDDDPTPYIFESDAAAIRAFVREMVTQSVVPGMERLSALWNNEVASRRRGIAGKLGQVSKRFTFGFSSRGSTGGIGGSNSNYDALQGFYKPDTPEAVLRKLADYAFMLRDFKLAQSTYDLLCTDYKNDKAWKHYAGANEMAALTALLSAPIVPSRIRVDSLDQLLETAYYSYLTRCSAPYSALRTLILSTELLRLRGGSALDDSARWATRILEDRLVGATGHALLLERIASCYSSRRGHGTLNSGSRQRKAAFYHILAAEAWLKLDNTRQSEINLSSATEIYTSRLLPSDNESCSFEHLESFLLQLKQEVLNSRPVDRDAEEDTKQEQAEDVQAIQEQPASGQRSHARSLSSVVPAATSVSNFDPLGVAVLGPHSPTLEERPDPANDGFE
ncbi:unnamed protein product [Aureobasidium uvarum]|uniref:ER-golgi trafficking TRAPP I complex 85 kDa subunit-domain-containing protein n=1 Tax=Aureobasidium uvarum TaxID=2773716 RepID=A0A9N8PSB2_9PEZI|nr:unnamed protein product [Aureobasidium uvarum]